MSNYYFRLFYNLFKFTNMNLLSLQKLNDEMYKKRCRILYITNLHYDSTEKELESAFGDIVPIEKVYILYKADGTSTGTGEIVLHSSEDAGFLKDRIDNTLFNGRIIRVKWEIMRKDTFSSSTYLVDNLPFDVTSRKLKTHFRYPFQAKRASVLYNEDGSSTGRALVEIILEKYDIDVIYECDQCKINGKKMEFRELYMPGYATGEFYMNRYKYLQLFIVNLHYDVKAEELEAYFGKWFEVAEAILYYKEDGTSTGMGAITFYKSESIPKILSFIRKAFEDRIWSVMCPTNNKYDYSDDVESNFDSTEEEVEKYTDVDKKVQSTFTQTDVVGRRSSMDDVILMKQFNKGGSKERLLKLMQYNSFAKQYFNQRSYFVALRLGIPECEFHCAIYVTNLHYDITEEELRAFFSVEVPVTRTFIIVNRVGTNSGTGMVVLKSRRDRLSCLLLLENKKLKGRIINMKCVPGLTNRCWDYI